MPDMLPVVGPAARHKGLWFNFGHGHQGFTLGPATGRILAELMNGEPANIDVAACAPARFGA
jgi:D-amino-acid dehydrogenase